MQLSLKYLDIIVHKTETTLQKIHSLKSATNRDNSFCIGDFGVYPKRKRPLQKICVLSYIFAKYCQGEEKSVNFVILFFE